MLPLFALSQASRACLTATIDKRAIQWSTSVVVARLTSLGQKIDLPSATPPATRPSGRPAAVAYRVVSFEVIQNIDGTAQAGTVVKALVLIGGQPGDGICPALLPESVGKKYVLLLRPFDQTRLDVPDNTAFDLTSNTMVIVSQLGEADMNSETVNDLKSFISRTRGATVSSDQLAAQVDAVATAHDDTEAEQAEKALQDIGPDALPALQARLGTANDAGKTRLKHVIDDLSPPPLSAEPE
jgi:hypothetical protein